MSTSLFKVGDLVVLRSDPNVRSAVIEVIPGGAECRYRVFDNHAKVTYYESQLQVAPTATNDRQKLTVRELHAHLTSLQILSPSTATLFSLRSGRVRFVPYQYRPVLKLIRADRPRLLIADEVGVGKTIEAGLIIKELRARMDISSVLVICPKALVAEKKWFIEMKRFDEEFTALGGLLLRHCLQETHLDGEWPKQYAKVIIPFSLFNSDLLFGDNLGRGVWKDRGLVGLDPPPKFDLVIVDEAHHIRNPETFLHQGVRYLCDNAQAVLLLTATPVQLGSEDLFTLLNVLRPDLIIDRASFAQMSEPNRHINAAVSHCRMAEPNWQQEALTCLESVVQTEWGRLFLREAPVFQNICDQLKNGVLNDTDRIRVIRTLEELHTFSPVINRTRRRDIGEFTTRKPETVTVNFTAEQKQLHDDLLDVIARILGHYHGQQNVKFMMTTIRRQAASCLYGLAPLFRNILIGRLNEDDSDFELDLSFVETIRGDIKKLIKQAENLPSNDPKIEAFVKVLCDKNKLPNNKVMVFSTFRHTLAYLARHTQATGLRFGLVHGGVADDERADLRRRFALPKEDSNALDVLLSSEVGCEGLDFQHCNFLINYDLPWNPMKVEQRIGRIDRYGQESEAVAIINFVTPGTVDADIYERCLWRIGVFQHAIGGNEEILGTITQEIHDIAERFNLTTEERAQQFQQIADNSIRQVHEEQELESQQANLFGLDVPNQTWRNEIEAAETFWLSPAAIQHSVTIYIAIRLGDNTGHILGEKPLKTLRLHQEARNLLLEDYRRLPRSTEPMARKWESWLKGGQSTLSVTFDQETATENPKAAYLSVLHPLVRQVARYMEITAPKYCALTVKSNKVPPGTHLFVIYRWTKRGIKSDELLVTVADDPQLETVLFDLLPSAKDTDQVSIPEDSEYDALDMRHHSKWTEASANHIAENRRLVEYRIQSLTASHHARRNIIEEQLACATDDKIRRMREGELARVNADFDRRAEELQQSANMTDILTTSVVFGTLLVEA